MLTYTFSQIGTLIGYSGALFMASLFILIIVRIALAFVFKIFRLNIDYKGTLKTMKKGS